MNDGSPPLYSWSINFQHLQDYLHQQLMNTIKGFRWKEPKRERKDFNNPMIRNYLTHACCTQTLTMYAASTSIHPS